MFLNKLTGAGGTISSETRFTLTRVAALGVSTDSISMTTSIVRLTLIQIYIIIADNDLNNSTIRQHVSVSSVIVQLLEIRIRLKITFGVINENRHSVVYYGTSASFGLFCDTSW